MRSFHYPPVFPSNLDPPIARSLSIQFILQGLLSLSALLPNVSLKELGRLLTALDTLCFYSEILLQASPIDKCEMLTLLETMRSSALQAKWKENPSLLPQVDPFLPNFFHALAPFLKEARSDENVLIYLIENKEKLNAFLGPRSIEELLQSFFPAGHTQLRAAIFEGYTRRGFTHFLSTVEPLIDAIEWETPCTSTPTL